MDVYLEVTGLVGHPLHLSVDDVRQQFSPHTLPVRFQHDDFIFSATFTGARLWDLLQAADVDQTSAAAPRIRAAASDGLSSIIEWPEVDPAVSDRLILVAYEQDGGPLPEEDGPLRLIVPGDQRGRRFLRGLASLIVLGDDEA